ncbi:unnamed protein product [Phaedon cochleariae]|uniref:Parathyroid hormone/parathyroid hormone-related peptide receptor n=1 Tax=Phaedon cochleariae TaxID=80249 RepID=A0A9N9SEH6_PHACE|nr:unnamed protein product [Phaedon cochleariae]
MPNRHVQEVIENQDKQVWIAEQKCMKLYGSVIKNNHLEPLYNSTAKSIMCPPFFDKILCWPPTFPGELSSSPCPPYITGFKPGFNATRSCTANGTWYVNETTGEPWADYKACYEGPLTTIFTNNSQMNDNAKIYENLVPIVKVLSQTGYAVSLISLIVAFLIMLLIKKLHCARNILHMNLFASFIMRAFFYILKDILFFAGIGLRSDLREKDGHLYFKTDIETNNYECKMLTTLVQYFTTANYSWILMEGLYLNNLIFRALFADSSRNLIYYICLGWGLPLLIIIPWVVARLSLDDSMCWTMNDNLIPFLIIGIPTVISVLINFALFIVISIILFTKLRSPICEDKRRYQKWAKSTLVLVPLFGVHYAILLVLYFVGQTSLWLIFDILFGSFQGFFVAVLYCFLNGEVKTELKPHIDNLLTYLATNKMFRLCFPFREKFLRSAVGRQSVCTTLSCSSVYANGFGRTNKGKERTKSTLDTDKIHYCKGTKSGRNGINVNGKGMRSPSEPNGQQMAETSLCIERSEKNHLNSAITDEEICMLTMKC